MSADLFAAIKAGDTARVASLLDADPSLLEARDETGLPAYTVARYSRQDAVADLLLQRGAKLDIFAACLAGAKDHVTELLSQDRTLVSQYSHDGWTPLHLAAFFGSQAICEVLLANGADVHARSRNAMANTPLHAAAAGRKPVDVAAVLITHAADVNAKQHGGWTPLPAGAQNGHRPLITLLLAHGEDPKLRADNNQTALDLALTNGKEEAAEALESHADAKNGAA